MKLKASVNLKEFERTLDNAKKISDSVGKQAYEYFKDITPIDKGNARRRTTYDATNKTINANYAYASRLDEGYSKQAPKGMTDPTLDFIEKLIDEEIRKV